MFGGNFPCSLWKQEVQGTNVSSSQFAPIDEMLYPCCSACGYFCVIQLNIPQNIEIFLGKACRSIISLGPTNLT